MAQCREATLGRGNDRVTNGDTEGTLLFDPANKSQGRAALREAGIKRRKVLSQNDRIARAAHLKRARACQA